MVLLRYTAEGKAVVVGQLVDEHRQRNADAHDDERDAVADDL